MPCEIVVRSLVPALRSAIARELTQIYGLRQKEVATLLGVTQTAVSKYIRYVRGMVLKVEDIEEIKPTLKEIVVSLVNGQMSRYKLMAKLCSACKIIRQKGLMCDLCKFSFPLIDIQQCFVCRSDDNPSNG